MNMTPERFAQIVEAYGSQPARWPEEERTAAVSHLSASIQAQTLSADYATLECLLDELPVAPMPWLEQRVLRQAASLTRDSLLDQALDWLLPRSGRLLGWIWRPALVAALPVVFGIYMANFFSFGINGTEHSWEEELYLLSLNDYAEIAE